MRRDPAFFSCSAASSPEFLRLVCGFASGITGDVGRKDRCRRERRLVQQQVHRNTGSNLNMTRTPDVHFVAEARHNGSKMVVLSPDFSEVANYADWWIPIHAGMDGAFWMAVDHVILQEFHGHGRSRIS